MDKALNTVTSEQNRPKTHFKTVVASLNNPLNLLESCFAHSTYATPIFFLS